MVGRIGSQEASIVGHTGYSDGIDALMDGAVLVHLHGDVMDGSGRVSRRIGAALSEQT